MSSPENSPKKPKTKSPNTKEDVESLARANKEDIENLAQSNKEEIASLARSTKDDIASLARLVENISGSLQEEMRAMRDEVRAIEHGSFT